MIFVTDVFFTYVGGVYRAWLHIHKLDSVVASERPLLIYLSYIYIDFGYDASKTC